MKWVKRIFLGLIGFVLVAVGALLLAIHTDWGREQIRKQVASALNDTFVGGGSLGKLEGSPFTALVLRDLVINGPDGKPAITAKKARVELQLLPLIHKRAVIEALVIEDGDIDLRKDDAGNMQVGQLVKPGPSGHWRVELRSLVAQGVHLAVADQNFDNVTVVASLTLAADSALDLSAIAGTTWREKQAPVALMAHLTKTNGLMSVPYLTANVGSVHLGGRDIRMTSPIYTEIVPGVDIVLHPEVATTYAGHLAIDAPAAGVALLAPSVELPGDVRTTLDISAMNPWTQVVMTGRIAEQLVHANVGVDLASPRLRAYGTVITDDVDVTRLSGGRVTGHGLVQTSFAVTQGAPGQLPIGQAIVAAAGQFEAAPYATATVVAGSDGTRVTATVGATGPAAEARLQAVIAKAGDALTLESSHLIASTSSPETTSQGIAPVRGAVAANLEASGALLPSLDLAVQGRVNASRLRVADVSVRSLQVAIDAKHLPSHPVGRTEITASDLVRQDVWLRDLALTAGTRDDGKIAVSVRTRPSRDPWLVNLDALVDLGTASHELRDGAGDTITVQLAHHDVRAADYGTWKGDSGTVTISDQRISLAGFETHSGTNDVALDGEYFRTGGRAGDLEAHAKLGSFDLASIFTNGVAGKFDAKVDVERRNGRFAGEVNVDAKSITLLPLYTPLDLNLHLAAGPDSLKAAGTLHSLTMGDAHVMIDLDAPKDITDVEAWRKLTRTDIRILQLKLDDLKVSRLAMVTGFEEKQFTGSLDGELNLSAKDIGGTITAKDVVTPWNQTLGKLNAKLSFAPAGPNTITPSITASIAGVGKVDGQATVELPNAVASPAAWRALGPNALKGAKVQLAEIDVDPAWFQRFGLETELQGRVSGGIEVTQGIREATVNLRAREVHGMVVSQPVDLDVAAKVDGAGTHASVQLVTAPQQLTEADRASPIVLRKPLTLLDIQTAIPVTMAQLREDPSRLATAPLNITAKLPDVPAPQLLAVFGRSDVRAGRISGTVEVTGEVAAPQVAAHLAATDLALESSFGTRKVRAVKRLSVEARWDGATQGGHVEIDGVEEGGSLHVVGDGNLHSLKDGSVTIEAKTFDLAPVLALAPGAAGAARGIIDGKVTVQGLDPRTAKLAGEIHLKNARMPIAPQVGTLRKANVDITIDDHALTVKMDGKLGAGAVKLDGKFDMNGATPTGGTATMTLRKVSPIGEVEPQIDADISAKFHRDPSMWVADVDVTKGNVDVPDERGEALKPIGAPDDMIFIEKDVPPELRKAKLAKPVSAFPAFRANITLHNTAVKSTELRGNVHGNMRIDIDPNFNLALLGTIEADRGDLDLFGRRYQVERAAVRFDGTVDPLLDVMISHDFPDVTTTTQVRGRVSAPEIILSSNPGTYSQGQLLGFLLGGEPSGEPADGNPRDKVASAGASFIGNQIGGYVKDKLPFNVDVIKYEAASATSSQAVTVGSWLTRNLFLAYRQRFAARPDENTGEASLEYYLTRRLVVEGVVGDKSRNSADLLWRRRY